ncbi:leucyl/phenylalanyl-tRNA--protein transferase, partial [Campylobacter lari]|nr:leucyl/phenylalanyl-tRNA--protein transferase [Campylobacter lari]
EFMGAKNIERKTFLDILKEKCDQESGFINFNTLIK